MKDIRTGNNISRQLHGQIDKIHNMLNFHLPIFEIIFENMTGKPKILDFKLSKQTDQACTCTTNPKNFVCPSKFLKLENDVLFSNDTGILGKRNSEFSQQESNLRPSDY